MKAGYKILSRLIIISFIFFWIGSAVFSFSTSTRENVLGKKFFLPAKMFSHTWALFYKSFDLNDKLYLILRDSATKQVTDSLELMGEIAYYKSKNAPFNQHYYVLDRFISHSVTLVKSKEVQFRNSLKKDSLFEQKLQQARDVDKGYQQRIGTLINYCRYVLNQKKIDTAGKEFKIMIKTKYIKRFEERNNKNYVPKQSIYFESAYTHF